MAKKRAKGGKVVEMNDVGGREMEEAKEKKGGFKRGGVTKRASGGRVGGSPYSSARSLSDRASSRTTGHEGGG